MFGCEQDPFPYPPQWQTPSHATCLCIPQERIRGRADRRPPPKDQILGVFHSFRQLRGRRGVVLVRIALRVSPPSIHQVDKDDLKNSPETFQDAQYLAVFSLVQSSGGAPGQEQDFEDDDGHGCGQLLLCGCVFNAAMLSILVSVRACASLTSIIPYRLFHCL